MKFKSISHSADSDAFISCHAFLFILAYCASRDEFIPQHTLILQSFTSQFAPSYRSPNTLQFVWKNPTNRWYISFKVECPCRSLLFFAILSRPHALHSTKLISNIARSSNLQKMLHPAVTLLILLQPLRRAHQAHDRFVILQIRSILHSHLVQMHKSSRLIHVKHTFFCPQILWLQMYQNVFRNLMTGRCTTSKSAWPSSTDERGSRA